MMLEQELTPECRSIFRQSALLAQLGVFIIDADTGACLYCSEQLANMHGISPEACRAMIGTDALLEKIHDEDRAPYQAALAAARESGDPYQIEYRMRDEAGGLVWLREMGERVSGESGAPRLVGCVQDLSEPKRIEATLERRVAERTAELQIAKEAAEAAEQAATASNHRFTAAAEALTDGLAIFDADDRLVFHNSYYPAHAPPDFKKVLGIGKRFADMIRETGSMYHPDMGEGFLERRLARPPGAEQEMVFRIADGRWVRVREGPIEGGGRVLLTSDITDQRAATVALEEREQRLRAIADGVPVAIIIVRVSQQEVLFVNELAAETFGFRVGPQGDGLAAVYAHPGDRRRLYERVMREGRVDGYVALLRRVDGTTMWALISARTITVAGEPAVLITATDISQRMASEAELEEREERFRAVAEGVPLAVTIARLEPPEILFANARAEETFGLHAGDRGDSILAVYFEPEDRAALVDELERSGLVDHREVQLRRADGSVQWALMSVRAITFNGEPAMLSAVTEINDRKLMEQALRESEARLTGFLENAPAGMYLKDLEGRYTLLNPEMSKVLGRPAAEALGLRVGDILPAETAAMIEQCDRDVVENGVSHMIEHHLLNRDAYAWIMGIRFPMRDQDGKINQLGGFAVDITERKTMEQALKASEQRFRVLAEAHPVPLFIVRMEDGMILVATPPCEALLGVPLEELIGNTTRRFYVRGDERDAMVVALRREGSLNGYEIQLRRADGTTFWCALTARLITFEGEQAIVTAAVDLTESKRIEAELDRQSALLNQNEKLSALGSLLAGVAHELNNPLSLVVGYAGLLEEMAPDGATKERAVKVRIAADRCARIVRTFLAMARNKPRAPGSVQLNEVVEAALEIVAYGLRTADIEVDCKLAPDLPQVHGDADQLHQVLANLLVNAQQALQTVPPPRRVRVSTGTEGDAVWVAISDNGPGIPASLVSRIFEPFFTTKPQGVGTGVGLSVSHGIISAHGGQIQVESDAGSGTTFTVRLLRARTGQKENERASVPETHRKASILVVDDEPDIGHLLTDILQGDGHEVATAASGREALDWLSGREVDLIISDLRMPDMDGPGLYRTLAEQRPELLTRLVFITGDTLAADITGFLSETGVSVIEKPLDPPDVSRTVQALLADYEALSATNAR